MARGGGSDMRRRMGGPGGDSEGKVTRRGYTVNPGGSQAPVKAGPQLLRRTQR